MQPGGVTGVDTTNAIARVHVAMEQGFTTQMSQTEARLSERMESTVVDINSRIARWQPTFPV